MSQENPELTSDQEKLQKSREEIAQMAWQFAATDRQVAKKYPDNAPEFFDSPLDKLHAMALDDDIQRERKARLPHCVLRYSSGTVEGDGKLMDYHISGTIEDGRTISLHLRRDTETGFKRQAQSSFEGAIEGVGLSSPEAKKLFLIYMPDNSFPESSEESAMISDSSPDNLLRFKRP